MKKMFKFRDGTYEIVEGIAVYIKNCNSENVRKTFVSNIGRTLVHLECGLSFYIEDGIERSDYSHNFIYYTERGFRNEEEARTKAIEISSRIYGTPLNKCNEILAILNSTRGST